LERVETERGEKNAIKNRKEGGKRWGWGGLNTKDKQTEGVEEGDPVFITGFL